MKKHILIYLNAFNLQPYDGLYIPCEIGRVEGNNCKGKATDCHHIDCRGMGGSKGKDRIENLMYVCRNCHNEYGDIKHLMSMLYTIHKKRMELANVDFDETWINQQIEKYDD